MKIRALLSMAVLILMFLFGQSRAEKPAGREYLLFEEIPSVYTASKADQSLERATAVVTVVTDADIQRWGTRTLYEVLKRVPGFFPSSQATWTLIGSRGLTSDGNDHILLLIDGHVQNSIVGQGYQQQDMLPILEKVRKIEIVRGPGSVVWGSSAVLGIINIITKDESDPRDQLSTSYGDRDGMFSANVMHSLSNEGKDLSGVFSLSFWQSRGYDRSDKSGGATRAFTKDGADEVRSNVEFPWGRIGDWPAIDRQKAGWEVYSRLKVGTGNEILARLTESRVVYPWDTWMDNPGSELRMRKAYLDFRHQDSWGEHVTFKSTVYADMLLQNRFPVASELFRTGTGTNRGHMQDQSNEEEALGAELSANILFAAGHHSTVGVKVVHASIGPNRDSRFDISTNRPTSVDYPYVGVESGADNTEAAYFEDTWDVNHAATTLFYGARVENNDFREKRAVFLPRGGLIHSLSRHSTIKYVCNTGYLRPNAVYSKTTGIIVDSTRGTNQDILLVDRSERILNHEIQLYRRGDTSYLAGNVFYMLIKNYISFDANNTPQGYKNLGNAVSRGLELEGRRRVSENWDLYGNYSFARAKLNDSRAQGALTNQDNLTLNYPSHIANLGLTWSGRGGKRTFNMNVNGWRGMRVMKPLSGDGSGGSYGKLQGECYLDLEYRHAELFGPGIGVSAFCMNVFDNTHEIGMIVNNGVWFPRGRNLGAGLEYRW